MWKGQSPQIAFGPTRPVLQERSAQQLSPGKCLREGCFIKKAQTGDFHRHELKRALLSQRGKTGTKTAAWSHLSVNYEEEWSLAQKYNSNPSLCLHQGCLPHSS